MKTLQNRSNVIYHIAYKCNPKAQCIVFMRCTAEP